MKSNIAAKTLLLVALLLATNAYAVIIEGNFQGTVRFYSDDYEESAWSGYWDQDIAGTTATGSFWYDTDKAPGNISTHPTSSQFRSNTNEWMDFSFTISAKTFTVSDLDTSGGNSSSLELLTLQDFVPSIDGSSLERFFLSKSMSFYSGSIQRSIHGSIQIYEYNESLLDDLGLAQEFDWLYSGGKSYGRANFRMLDYLGSNGKAAMGWIEIDEIHVKAKNSVGVPEPSPFVILIVGFVALFLKRSYKS